jgi:hypothetical protein
MKPITLIEPKQNDFEQIYQEWKVLLEKQLNTERQIDEVIN